MARRKKKEAPETEVDVQNTTFGPRLAVLVLPNCPACKKLLGLKTMKYYLGKGLIDVVNIMEAKWVAGEWTVNEWGLVYQLSTPTFIVYCGSYDNVIWKYRVRDMFEIQDPLVTMIVSLYKSKYAKTICQN